MIVKEQYSIQIEPGVDRALQGPREVGLKQKHWGGHQNCPDAESFFVFLNSGCIGEEFFEIIDSQEAAKEYRV